MKKMMISLKVVVLLLLLQSCRKPDLGPVKPIPSCAWDRTTEIMYSNLQLKYPAGLSDYHTRQLPNGGTDNSFIDVLLRNNDVGSIGHKAELRVNVKSDGTKCIGEKTTTYDRSNYLSGINGYFIRTPFPSNTAFFGEITVTLKSNVYSNTVGNGAFYHILWEQTGNNPNGGMPNTMIGKKISYFTINGINLIIPEPDNNYYYSGGVEVAL